MSIFKISQELPRSYKTNERWRELFEAIEEVLEGELGSIIERVDTIGSVLTAQEQDLELYRNELDPQFFEAFSNDNVRISLFAAQTERHKKNTIEALRPFLLKTGIESIDWEPLYIAKAADYTQIKNDPTLLKTEDDILKARLDINDFWLTSRGQVTFETGENISKNKAYNWINEGMRSAKPLQIVWEGFFAKESDTTIILDAVESARFQAMKLNTTFINL